MEKEPLFDKSRSRRLERSQHIFSSSIAVATAALCQHVPKRSASTAIAHGVNLAFKQRLWTPFLEISGADLGRRDLSGNREHGDAGAMAIEQPVDEMQIAWSAASRTNSKLARQMRFSTRGERASSCLTWTHSILPWRRRESVRPLRLSPTIP
jgi:hypothetical protein